MQKNAHLIVHVNHGHVQGHRALENSHEKVKFSVSNVITDNNCNYNPIM